jgi:cellulose synthase/poly-beta-1,6-N-acetylglucosamine synthase-like glycosyltransferase
MVSVVMSVLNGERFLPEAVESILEQSFRDFEFIVINDGSTDGSGSMLDSYRRSDPRVRVYHQENRGLIESLNRGSGLAQGKYIARMDADDIAIRDRLMWQVDFMEQHPEVGVVGGAIEVINTKGKAVAIERNPTKDREIKLALLRGYCPLVHPTVLMRKEALVSVEGYRKVVVHAEDYDLWLRIADQYQLANLEAVVLKYRRHSCQVSVRRYRQQALSSLAARAAALSRRNGKPDPLDSVGEITPALLTGLGVSEATQQSTLGRSYVTCLRSMCDAGEYPEALTVIDTLRRSDWKHFGSPVIADFHVAAARLYWRQRRFARSILSAGHALITRPIMLGRPLKPLLRRLRLVQT